VTHSSPCVRWCRRHGRSFQLQLMDGHTYAPPHSLYPQCALGLTTPLVGCGDIHAACDPIPSMRPPDAWLYVVTRNAMAKPVDVAAGLGNAAVGGFCIIFVGERQREGAL